MVHLHIFTEMKLDNKQRETQRYSQPVACCKTLMAYLNEREVSQALESVTWLKRPANAIYDSMTS
jgi:hypothetical protein